MAGKHRSAGAWRPRRAALSALGTLALVSVGVIVGFAGTGGTYAAWKSAATVSGATIKTGSASLQVSDGTAAFADSFDLGALTGVVGPGVGVAKSFVVKNTGTTKLALVGTVSVPAGAPSLASALDIAILDPGSAGCSTSLATQATTPLASYSPPLPTLDANATQTLCLVLAVPMTDTSSAQGQAAQFTVNISGTQVAP
jgi:hypothetical protein